MIALLDTHAFIWLDADRAKIGPAVQACLADPRWTVYLSVVSVWEMVIKVRSGKLSVRADVGAIVTEHLAQSPLRLLPIQHHHALEVGNLPPIHKDPFDRMLVAQAVAEGAVLLTSDPVIRRYPVRIDW